MKVYVVMSRCTNNSCNDLHNAYGVYIDKDNARAKIEELREDGDDKYYYIYDLIIEDYEQTS
jgi:hypothetical protein